MPMTRREIFSGSFANTQENTNIPSLKYRVTLALIGWKLGEKYDHLAQRSVRRNEFSPRRIFLARTLYSFRGYVSGQIIDNILP